MTLADKLKEARKNAGLTQIELAEKLCVSRQAITKWETGKGISDAEITPLLAKKKSTKGQKLFGELLGWLTDAPFGTDEIFNQISDFHNSYYLVHQEDRQIFVTVTEDFIESKVMAKNVTGDKFEIGDYKYQKAAYRVEK